jgi:putative colanic acid biosynthesis UDP-glucose lipid carrier transferase
MDSILLFIFHFFLTGNYIDYYLFVFIGLWFFIAYFTRFYHIDRISRPAQVFSVSSIQFIIYDISILALYKILDESISNKTLLYNLFLFNLFVLIFKLLAYVLIKFYRAGSRNQRNFVIIGYNDQTQEFKNLLSQRKDYGFRFKGFFSGKEMDKPVHKLDEIDKFLSTQNIDVIFCSLNECSDEEINNIVQIADNHFVNVKFIPDNKQILKRKHVFEYYDYFPVFSPIKSPLDKIENRILKRMFDIVFSLLVVIFILSWLYPLLWIFIKIESQGPAIFVQKRNGINYKVFNCYKFRSMRQNDEADTKQVTKGDSRITKIGLILRQTSLDELPQFINVLKGEMSVVGPRPHMIHENERFRNKVENFMGRHYIKPGITGLAQVKGYRGEIITDDDLINRIKYDLFYIENWSFWLDLKIIIFTIINVFKGDKKAY